MTTRNVGKQNEPETSPGGWVVKTGQGYYTGHGRRQFERWTAFPKWAKVYTRKGWAQKIAERFGGQVVLVGESAYPSAPGQPSAGQAHAVPVS